VKRALAWAAWLTVLFGIYNLALPHARFRATELAIDRGGFSAVSFPDAARGWFTNDGDVRRYLAYCDAALGRPYAAYFVRSTEAWRKAFAVEEPWDDGARTITPGKRLLPYRDFLVEYPPGFFLVAMPPAWLTSDGYRYLILFGSLMALLLTAALFLAARTAPLVGAEVSAPRLAAWGAGAALLLGIIATHRYDAAVALTLCAMAWAGSARRPLLLGLSTGLAFAVKIVPILAAPIWLMHLLRARRWREIAFAALVAALVAISLSLPAIRAAGDSLLDILRYHRDRPLQIESTWAALLGLWHPSSVTVAKTFGSTNLVGAPAKIALTLSTVVSALSLIAVYAITWRRLDPRRSDEERNRVAVSATAMVLVLFITCGKVCSPQYLVWLLPLGLLLSLADGRKLPIALFLVTMALTQVIYPIGYGALESLQPWACAMVILRQAALMVWAVLVFRDQRSASDPIPTQR
jgi:hypothetical protein